MKVSDFDYELPAECIAQRPASRRDRSRLLVLDRGSGATSHHRFSDLPDLLSSGDLLVLNDTRVVPARLIGRKPTGGRVELFLLERDGADRWRCLIRSRRATRPGARVDLDAQLSATVLTRGDDDWLVRLESSGGPVDAALERLGRMPLPPYIKRDRDGSDEADRARYQTVYSRRPGAVAAPTAGLHFTEGLLDSIGRAGVQIAYLTLHVGPGTFQPVRVERVENHRLHEEWCELPERTAGLVERTRRDGGRIVAVGTTVVRTLESRFTEEGRLRVGAERCDLFIYPGFRFRVVDAMVTNFHLPRSTLLMLVAAFGGRARVLSAYREAVSRGYRFYSYGDAMLLRSQG